MNWSLRRNADRAAVAVLCLIVAAIGLLDVVERKGETPPGSPSYERIADNLLQSGTYSLDGESPTAYRMPLYPAFVAAVKLLGGDHWVALLLALQSALTIATGLLWHATSRRLTSVWWVPPLVALTFAAHLSLHWEFLKLRETAVFGFLVASFFYVATSDAPDRSKLWRMAVLCVLAHYTRPTGFLLLVPLVALALLQADKSGKTRAIAASSLVAIFVLAAVPWQAYQSNVVGQLVLAPTNVVGFNRYTRSSLAFERLAPYVDPDIAAHDYASPIVDAGLEGAGPSRAWISDDRLRALASRDIAADPGRYVRKIGNRAKAYLSPLKTPLGSAEIELREGRLHLNDYRGNLVDAAEHWSPFLRHTSLFVIALFAIPIGLLGMLRLSLVANRARALAIASLAYVAACVALHALTGAETRYRLPLDPLFITWAWLAIGLLFRADARPAGVQGPGASWS